MFWCFSHKTYVILAPQLGMEPVLPVLESEVLMTGPLGKSLKGNFL